MPEQLVQYLIKEWNTLKDAPLTFILLAFFSFGAAALAVTWLYKSTIDTLTHRIASKDDLLAEYRERLHLDAPDQTKYSKLTNQELRTQTLALVAAIRAFHATAQSDSRQISDSQMNEMQHAKSEEERNQIWKRFTNRLTEDHYAKERKYTDQFSTKSLILRDELLSRLPPVTRNRSVDRLYERPNYHWSSIEVSADLERLAYLLS